MAHAQRADLASLGDIAEFFRQIEQAWSSPTELVLRFLTITEDQLSGGGPPTFYAGRWCGIKWMTTLANELGVPFDVVWEMVGFKDEMGCMETGEE